MKNPEPKKIIKQAQKQYHEEGRIEIDDGARISIAGKDPQGAYVEAWVWIDFSDIKKEK